MQNKYPFHIEKQLIDLYLKTVRKVSTSEKSKSSKIDTLSLKKEVSKNFKMLDAWSAFTLENHLLSLKKSEMEKLNLYSIDSILKRAYFPNKDAIAKLKKASTLKLKSDADSIGIDTIIGQPGITEDFINSTVEKNVGLIRDLEEDTRKQIQQAIATGIQSGKTIDELTKEIEKIAGISESRARFWAQDQSSKFFGAVTRQRQMAIGYDGFIWICVKDGKVRPTHLDFEGKYFDWQKGTGVTRRNFPGEDYRCRCFAKPSFKEDAPNEKDYKKEAERKRWEVAKETQASQIEFDKLYERLTKEAEDTARKGSRTVKTENGNRINGTKEQEFATKLILTNIKLNPTLESQEALTTGSELEIGIIVDKNGNKEYLTGGVNYIEIPDKISLKGKTFTHNHPRGSSISDADLKIFLESELQELRVTTSDYIYSISNPDNIKLDYKKVKDYFNSMYKEAKNKINKDKISPSEIINKQWELTAQEFDLKYRRIKYANNN